MEVAEIGRKKINQSVRHQQQHGELRKNQHRDARLIDESEKMVEELQQQMFYIGRKIPEKQLNLGSAKSKASYRLDYGWSYGEKMIYRNSVLDRKKMELEKLTFTHGACRDKKAVLYFSSGREPEVNIHNLNCRMLHEARSIGEERLFLNMANKKKHSNSGSSLKELDQQVKFISLAIRPSIRPYSLFYLFILVFTFNHLCCIGIGRICSLLTSIDNLFVPSYSGYVFLMSLFQSTQICWLGHDLVMKWRLNSTSDRDETRRKLMELVLEREQLFRDAPVKGFLWNSLPSTTNLRKQIQSLEKSKEKRIKAISERRKEIESHKRELRKAENEIKSLRKTLERIRQKKQKALQTLSLLKESLQEPL
ncbi:unnamed protein product [Brassica napus]|uniref:(rape) hypothetical protein n=1 Tax=Brassica napus TaxID=3708 RepID=A0A816S9K5_BRANA|nr:unnamed protein product [Brassica napus]